VTGSRRAAKPRAAAGSGWRQGQPDREHAQATAVPVSCPVHEHTQTQGAREEKAGGWLMPHARSAAVACGRRASGGQDRPNESTGGAAARTLETGHESHGR
jgi:hypothetical protein